MAYFSSTRVYLSLTPVHQRGRGAVERDWSEEGTKCVKVRREWPNIKDKESDTEKIREKKKRREEGRGGVGENVRTR